MEIFGGSPGGPQQFGGSWCWILNSAPNFRTYVFEIFGVWGLIYIFIIMTASVV